MKIYTKTGDRGETALFGGTRVPKDAERIEAYGSVDELNAVIGVARSFDCPPPLDGMLESIQKTLFVLGADLATPLSIDSALIPRISAGDAALLEKNIDRLEKDLQPLKAFILPGGSRTASQLHLARTVCRRAERMTVGLSRRENIGREVVVYLNRLSDLLFVMARYANHREGMAEHEWSSGKQSAKKTKRKK